MYSLIHVTLRHVKDPIIMRTYSLMRCIGSLGKGLNSKRGSGAWCMLVVLIVVTTTAAFTVATSTVDLYA